MFVAFCFHFHRHVLSFWQRNMEKQNGETFFLLKNMSEEWNNLDMKLQMCVVILG